MVDGPHVHLSLLSFWHGSDGALGLAELADAHGFHRFWIGEHLQPLEYPTPMLLCALLLGSTERVRVGVGAVSLTYRSPLQLAMEARFLNQLGDRFDFGVAKGLGALGPGFMRVYGDQQDPCCMRPFAEKVQELRGILDADYSVEVRNPAAFVAGEARPPLWVMGTSEETARLAGLTRSGFATSKHHGVAPERAAKLFATYREAFGHNGNAEPETIYMISGFCDYEGAGENTAGIINAPPGELAENLLRDGRSSTTDEVMYFPLYQPVADLADKLPPLWSAWDSLHARAA